MRGPQDCKELSSMDGHAAGTHLVQSLGCLVPHLQSPLHLGRSPSSLHLCRKCSWETSSPYCGYSQMEEEEMADGFADYLQVPSEAQLVSHFTCASCLLIASCKPPGINPVMCLTQRSQKLFPPCLDLEARPEINPDQCFVHSYSLQEDWNLSRTCLASSRLSTTKFSQRFI